MVGEITAPGLHIMCQSSTPQDIAEFVVSAASNSPLRCVVVSSYRTREIQREIYDRMPESNDGRPGATKFFLDNKSSIQLAWDSPMCLYGAVYDLIVVDGLVSEQMQKECELRLLRQTLSPDAFYMTA